MITPQRNLGFVGVVAAFLLVFLMMFQTYNNGGSNEGKKESYNLFSGFQPSLDLGNYSGNYPTSLTCPKLTCPNITCNITSNSKCEHKTSEVDLDKVLDDQYRFCMRHTADGNFSPSGIWTWNNSVKHCGYSLFSREEGLQIFGTHKMVLVGDSQSRYFFSNIVNVLTGGLGKPGREKRGSDLWQSPLGGSIIWPKSSQVSTMLAEDLITFSNEPDYFDVDIWVITNGHWDAAYKSTEDFKNAFPSCLESMRALSRRKLPSGRTPLVIWHSPNAISREKFYSYGSRENVIQKFGRYERPIILDEINEYVQSTGLYDLNQTVSLLDFYKLATMRWDWIRDDVVHGSDQCYKFGWQLLQNIIRIHDHYHSIATPQTKQILDFFSVEGTQKNGDIPWY